MKALTLSLVVGLCAMTSAAQAGSYSYYVKSNPYSDYSTVTEYGPNGVNKYQVHQGQYGTKINNYGTGESWRIRSSGSSNYAPSSGYTVDYFNPNSYRDW
jgi:hypothetical protein